MSMPVRRLLVQRLTAIIMLVGTCLMLDALLSRPTHAQETLHDELKRLGMLPVELATKSQEIALTAQQLRQLEERVKAIEALDIKTHFALLEEYVRMAKETQLDVHKEFWGVMIMLGGFIAEKLYMAFFGRKTP